MANAVNSADGHLVMWSIGQIAERDGISKPAVSKMVAKLIRDHDLPVTRDGRGRVQLVSVADYDHHRAFFGSSVQDARGEQAPVDVRPQSQSESRDEALRQKAWMEVRRQRLEDAKEAGLLVRSDLLRDALAAAARTIQSEVGRLANRADDIALAVSKEGTSGARMALRKIADEINERAADALAKIAAEAPERDEALTEVPEE
ncbi:MAG TPA: hypothetical protein VGN79_12275 [Devosia sp.]|jgi:hypothetical protein|nr:hypothetical protein [Devosia sp.]